MQSELNDDERRLLRLFRCLSSNKQSDILSDVGSQAMKDCLPDKSIYELMPAASGIKPEGIEYINDTGSIAHVIYCGIQETGDPEHCLLGSSVSDEEETIPRFVRGAQKAALEQNSFFNYDEDFAREYLNAWRREIVSACKRSKTKEQEIL